MKDTPDTQPSIDRKRSLRELNRLPHSELRACWMLLLFCWRRDQNSTFFFFFGAWIIVRMCPGCLTSLPHLPRPLESNHNPPGSRFLRQKNTSALSLESVLLCRCAVSQGGWPSPRLNAPRVSCVTARVSSQPSQKWLILGYVAALYTVGAVSFLILGISVGGLCCRLHTIVFGHWVRMVTHWFSLYVNWKFNLKV